MQVPCCMAGCLVSATRVYTPRRTVHCKKYPYIDGYLWNVGARVSLFRRFADTNVYGTSRVKIRKTRHEISVDIGIFFTVYLRESFLYAILSLMHASMLRSYELSNRRWPIYQSVCSGAARFCESINISRQCILYGNAYCLTQSPGRTESGDCVRH